MADRLALHQPGCDARHDDGDKCQRPPSGQRLTIEGLQLPPEFQRQMNALTDRVEMLTNAILGLSLAIEERLGVDLGLNVSSPNLSHQEEAAVQLPIGPERSV